jgi:hypothetical protein
MTPSSVNPADPGRVPRRRSEIASCVIRITYRATQDA